MNATTNTNAATVANKGSAGKAPIVAGHPVAPKAKRVAKAKRDDVIVVGVACKVQIDALATTLQEKFGFKPTAEQTIGWAITNAQKATTPAAAIATDDASK